MTGWRAAIARVRAGLAEGCSPAEAEHAQEFGNRVLDEVEAQLAALAPPASADAVYVVVTSNDGAKPDDDEPRGPLVWETYTRKATREEAMRRAAQLERKHGPCNIARLVFDDQLQEPTK